MRRAAVVLLLCACVPSTQGAIRPALSPVESLRHSIDSLAADPQFRNSQIGILIVKPGSSDTLYSRNAGMLFIPASNMKIITGSVALAQLGADYRYRTAFVTRGAIRDGALDGDLIVIGRGDPTVSDRAQQGGARAWMVRAADSLAARGIKRIGGGLVRGGNAFPDSIYGYGWEWDDLSGSSAAPVDELEYNEGMTTVRQHIAGRDTVIETATRNPARTYLEALASALAERGITVGAGVSDSTADIVVPRTDTLFTVSSPPLRDILRLLMKPSQNQIAEILLHTLGLERTGVGSADSGAVIVRRQLLAWGAEHDGFVVYDGSGMSRHDLMTPETLLRTLVAIQRDTAFSAFHEALPVAGVDGTLRTRMLRTTAAGNMHAKTGSLEFVKTLSGYVTDADGERIVFSILDNHFTAPVDSINRFQNDIGVLLAGYRDRGR